MYGIPARYTPSVLCILIDKRIATLKIGWELEQRVILSFDVFLRYLLLDDFRTPVILEPRLGNRFLCSAREKKGILCARNVKIDLESSVQNVAASAGSPKAILPCS